MSRASNDESQVSDDFGTFLESVKQASPEYPDEAPTSSTATDANPEAGSNVAAITILATLASHGQAMSLSDLLGTLGISSIQVGSILSPLIESKFVTLVGEPGSETVQLTADGARLTAGVNPT